MAASTHLSHVNGNEGILILSGYAAEELAPRATFEQVAYLFLRGRLPVDTELESFSAELASRRTIGETTLQVLTQAARHDCPPMEALLMAAPTLRLGHAEDPEQDALNAIAALPTIVGAYERLRSGKSPVEVRQDLSHAAYVLYQLSGETPKPSRVRALETYLNTVCDHGMNASTFAARVIVSTHSDLISAVTGAVGALKGPLHGGAPSHALDLIQEVGSAGRAEAVLTEHLDRGKRLMGFGHRIYRTRDPRADILAEVARRFYEEDGDIAFWQLAMATEKVALQLLRARKPGRELHTNVEFYTALLLHGLGIPSDLFTPMFAVGRVVGWSAHCLEQLKEGRIIRPQSEYVGPIGLNYPKSA